MIKLGSRRRRWWGALGLTVLLAAPALALTTITITGVITDVSADVTSGDIEVNDPFEIVMMFDETQVGGGKQTLTSGVAGFTFTLTIDGKLAAGLGGRPVRQRGADPERRRVRRAPVPVDELRRAGTRRRRSPASWRSCVPAATRRTSP
jgi:hypothetical protein